MRRDVKKFLFIGTVDVKESFFQEAQKEGVIHFIDPDPSQHKELPEEVAALLAAIKVLRSLPTMEQEETENFEQAAGIAERILELHRGIEQLEEESRILTLEIGRVEIFGNFSPENIAYIEKEGKRTVQFYCAKKGYFDHHELPDSVIGVGSDHGLDYFVGINSSPAQFEGMIEMKVEHPLGELHKRLTRAQGKARLLEVELKGFEKYAHFLHRALIDKMNSYHLVAAQEAVSYEIEQNLFAVSGWVPITQIDQLQQVVRKKNVCFEEVAIDEGEVAPTCLENENVARIGEDLVRVYDTPSNTDKDPSLWVLIFFSLFFAFIVGDGGYGLIFLSVALYLQFKIKKPKKQAKRLLSLVFILSSSCIIWGLMTSSFFGIDFAPHNPLQRNSLINWMVEKKVAYHQSHNDETYKEWETAFPAISRQDHPKVVLAKAAKESNGKKVYVMNDAFSDSIMLEMALLIGMIHISLSFLRYMKRNWPAIGWVIFIIGGYFYFPIYLGVATMANYLLGLNRELLGEGGTYLMAGGFGLAIALAVVQNKLLGFLELMTVIQIFSDILSYLRLYALGLAGGIVSATVNELAGSVIFVAGFLLLVVGHLFNITLSIMGGVIHGLRLNFIEWYHYSFQGGGKLFSPLRKLEID